MRLPNSVFAADLLVSFSQPLTDSRFFTRRRSTHAIRRPPPTGGDYGSIFMADNMTVTASIPEPMGLLAVTMVVIMRGRVPSWMRRSLLTRRQRPRSLKVNRLPSASRIM
jgi:hypothetical protein